MNVYWCEYKDRCVPQTFLLCCIFGAHFLKDDFHKSIPNLGHSDLTHFGKAFDRIEEERQDKVCATVCNKRENEEVLTDIEGEIGNHFSEIYLFIVCCLFLSHIPLQNRPPQRSKFIASAIWNIMIQNQLEETQRKGENCLLGHTGDTI